MPASMLTSFDDFYPGALSFSWIALKNPFNSIYSICIMQYVASVSVALNAPLKWALCVSPGQVRAGSLASVKESSYSVKRQLW